MESGMSVAALAPLVVVGVAFVAYCPYDLSRSRVFDDSNLEHASRLATDNSICQDRNSCRCDIA